MGVRTPTAPRGRQSHSTGTSHIVSWLSRRLRCRTDAAGVMLGDTMALAGVACKDGGVIVATYLDALHAPTLVQRNHVAVLSLPKMPRPGSRINHGIGNHRVS